MIGVMHAEMRPFLPYAAEYIRDLCNIYGPHRTESMSPRELFDYMLMNAEEITAEFHKLIQKEL
jgi:hypothetical protein